MISVRAAIPVTAHQRGAPSRRSVTPILQIRCLDRKPPTGMAAPGVSMSVTSFNELGLLPELLRAVTDAGYTTPTPIQSQAIPVVLTGRDVMGGAQTGTGKTAGFALPILQKLAPY